jgi:hypothetical protein
MRNLLMARFRRAAIASTVFVLTVWGATVLAQDVKLPTDSAAKAAFPEGAARAGPPASPTTISPPSEVRARPRSAHPPKCAPVLDQRRKSVPR